MAESALRAVPPIDTGSVEMVDLTRWPSDSDALGHVAETYASERCVLPIRIDHDGALVVAFADRVDEALVAELQVLVRRQLKTVVAPRSAVREAIRQRYRVLPQVDEWVRVFNEQSPVAGVRSDPAILGSESSPIVQIVDRLIAQGLRDRASDVHIEPQKDALRIRFRIDGLLMDAIRLPREMGPAIASRIKVMANMDIVDRHRAQDGQIRIDSDSRKVDIRVSTAETIWGEKLVLRLLDQGRTILSLNDLGLGAHNHPVMQRLLQSPYGMIIVSGPTGSGKTTSLYASIAELDHVTQNITTIEDPVEYTFDDINQIQIRKVANLTFANGLRAILRQDPDVILVGEIRDRETAEIAVQSSLTGHLVLSSLHATDAAGVIQRFIEMGVEGFLISSSLIGVVAQRLVRRICPQCQDVYKPSREEMRLWTQHAPGPKQVFYRGLGCESCAGTGYRGRVGVFEVLTLSDEIKAMVSAHASANAIRAQAVREGMIGLRADAVMKVATDVTTLAEVMRCVWLN
ncbi:MAG TPA: GspE/PulE family protein [Candidatus Dormibacteraeota bacterium]